MQVKYSEKAKFSKDYPLLEKATIFLQEYVARSANGITVEWDGITDPQGRNAYRLRIADSTDEATTDFSPDELKNDIHRELRLYHVWGNLLQVQSHRLLEKLQRDD